MKRINGNMGESISAADRGLLYGDGVFETMRCVNGEIPLLERHLARLRSGLERLGIASVREAELRSEVMLCAHARGNGIVKLIVTRGAGGRGYRPPSSVSPTMIVEDFPLPEWPPEWFVDGILIRTCQTRLASNDPLAGLKTLNRLPQVLARAEWDDPDITEGVMLDGRNQVVAGTMSNVFYQQDKQWFTPPLDSGVRGVMRSLILDEAGFAEKPLTFEEREHLQSMFVCNSVFGVLAIRQWDDMHFPSGTMPEAVRNIVQAIFKE